MEIYPKKLEVVLKSFPPNTMPDDQIPDEILASAAIGLQPIAMAVPGPVQNTSVVKTSVLSVTAPYVTKSGLTVTCDLADHYINNPFLTYPYNKMAPLSDYAGAGVNSVSLDWGDGTSSFAFKPFSTPLTHTYNAPGTYTVTLTTALDSYRPAGATHPLNQTTGKLVSSSKVTV
jgi:PKD repeat protein